MARIVSCLIASGLISIMVGVSTGAAADTHVIVATQQRTWTYNGHSSVINPPTPLVVDDLSRGDVIEIQIPDSIPHGFMTIKRQTGQDPTPNPDLILACGDAANSKPNAVLKELDCGQSSKVGQRLNNGAKLRLQVLDTFQDPIDFWCVVHLSQMLGTLKLK